MINKVNIDMIGRRVELVVEDSGCIIGTVIDVSEKAIYINDVEFVSTCYSNSKWVVLPFYKFEYIDIYDLKEINHIPYSTLIGKRVRITLFGRDTISAILAKTNATTIEVEDIVYNTPSDSGMYNNESPYPPIAHEDIEFLVEVSDDAT